MAELEIHQFPCLSDNYGVLIHEPRAGLTAAVDTPEPEAVRGALAETGWRLTHILTTHHHPDHIAGHDALKRETGCHIIGAAKDRSRIPGLDQAVSEGEVIAFGAVDIQVIETPGHTLGHLSYYLPAPGIAFTGDTLFSLGCGRLFEGTPAQMWHSLQKLMALPGDTAIYCGHEYTLANAQFALTVEPGNTALQTRAEEVRALRAAGKPTVPTRVDAECATNPFLRPDSAEIQAQLALALEGRPLEEVWAEIRRRKDRF